MATLSPPPPNLIGLTVFGQFKNFMNFTFRLSTWAILLKIVEDDSDMWTWSLWPTVSYCHGSGLSLSALHAQCYNKRRKPQSLHCRVLSTRQLLWTVNRPQTILLLYTGNDHYHRNSDFHNKVQSPNANVKSGVGWISDLNMMPVVESKLRIIRWYGAPEGAMSIANLLLNQFWLFLFPVCYLQLPIFQNWYF